MTARSNEHEVVALKEFNRPHHAVRLYHLQHVRVRLSQCPHVSRHLVSVQDGAIGCLKALQLQPRCSVEHEDLKGSLPLIGTHKDEAV